MRRTEDGEAKAFIQWCELHYLIKGLMVHVPNERKCSPQYGKKLKDMGVRRGFPDFFLPFISYPFYGLFIELKRNKASAISTYQKEWLESLNKIGYMAEVAYGADHAIKIVEEYLG